MDEMGQASAASVAAKGVPKRAPGGASAGRGGSRPVEEDDLDADAVEGAGGSKVTQPPQRRADKGGAAAAIVGEAVLAQNGQTVFRNPCFQCCKLAGRSCPRESLTDRSRGNFARLWKG